MPEVMPMDVQILNLKPPAPPGKVSAIYFEVIFSAYT
jgi:hypothetical protein